MTFCDYSNTGRFEILAIQFLGSQKRRIYDLTENCSHESK